MKGQSTFLFFSLELMKQSNYMLKNEHLLFYSKSYPVQNIQVESCYNYNMEVRSIT